MVRRLCCPARVPLPPFLPDSPRYGLKSGRACAGWLPRSTGQKTDRDEGDSRARCFGHATVGSPQSFPISCGGLTDAGTGRVCAPREISPLVSARLARPRFGLVGGPPGRVSTILVVMPLTRDRQTCLLPMGNNTCRLLDGVFVGGGELGTRGTCTERVRSPRSRP